MFESFVKGCSHSEKNSKQRATVDDTALFLMIVFLLRHTIPRYNRLKGMDMQEGMHDWKVIGYKWYNF